jgi:hypothetical protein
VFCPTCGAEYVAGFTECSDCLVPLVDSLPEPERAPRRKPKKPGSRSLVPLVDPVCVFRSTNPADPAVIESILESASIPFWVLNERVALTGLTAFGPVEVMVARADADDARAIIGDMWPPEAPSEDP